LQDDSNECHDGFDGAELQRRLFAEAQEFNRVRVPTQTACAVIPTRPDWFATDFAHDVALATQILITETEEIVDDKSLIAVPECVKVNVVAVVVEKE